MTTAGTEAPASPPGELRLLRFRVHESELAIDVRDVEEIAALGTPTSVPGMPAHVPGVVALRGEALPLLDVGAFLGLPPLARAADREPRLLVVRVPPYRVGLLADAVVGVHAAAESELALPTVLRPERLHELAIAQLDLGDSVVALLDLTRLLESARV